MYFDYFLAGSQFVQFLTIFDTFEQVFLDFFRNGTLHRAAVFCVVFWDGQKLPRVEKVVKKNSKKKSERLDQMEPENGWQKFNITSGAFGDTLLGRRFNLHGLIFSLMVCFFYQLRCFFYWLHCLFLIRRTAFKSLHLPRFTQPKYIVLPSFHAYTTHPNVNST